MYNCNICNETQVPRTKISRLVTKVRKVIYPEIRDSYGKIIKTPIGSEIVQELEVCEKCLDKHKDAPARVVDSKTLK